MRKILFLALAILCVNMTFAQTTRVTGKVTSSSDGYMNYQMPALRTGTLGIEITF